MKTSIPGILLILFAFTSSVAASGLLPGRAIPESGNAHQAQDESQKSKQQPERECPPSQHVNSILSCDPGKKETAKEVEKPVPIFGVYLTPQTLVGGVTAIFAMLAFFAAVKAATAATRQASAAERSLIVADRPYVLTKRLVLTRNPEGEWPFLVTGKVAIKNSGRTPALNINYNCDFFLGELPSRFDYSTLDRENPDLPLSSGAIYPLINRLRWISQEDSQRGTPLFLLGKIEYMDIFGRSHTTRFCWWVDPVSGDSRYGGGNEYNQVDIEPQSKKSWYSRVAALLRRRAASTRD